jgi:diguanylate cyclase (GGDEF)-like protein/PAS domain S-box-containing protein
MPDSMPTPEHTPVPDDGTRERLVLARKWAYVLVSTVFLAQRQDELEQELAGLLDEVCDAVHTEPFDTGRAHRVGCGLAELGSTDDEILRCTVDVLGKGLLSRSEFQPVDRFAERIVLVLGALACGFGETTKRIGFEQQERMNLSLIKAVDDAKGNLTQSEARFDAVAMSSASGVMITDLDGRLVRGNAAIGHMLGYTALELTDLNLFDIAHPELASALRADYQELLDGTRSRIQQARQLLCRNGDIAHVSLTATVLPGADDRPHHFVTVVEDSTELLLLQNELNRQALHDVLTGLPNRQFFSTHLESALRRADPAHGVTLFHLDIDAFALICNGLGRGVGDLLLRETGRRLHTVMAAEKAMIARFHGDEFAVLVENSATTPSVATTVATVNERICEPVRAAGHDVTISASIGVVHRPPLDMDPEELLREADQTLRRVKSAGCGQWGLFHTERDAHDRQTFTLAAGMSAALASGEISVVYRPVIRLADGKIAGVEALLRWEHPALGPVPHDRCVELAERTGLMLPLGEWLLRAMCVQAGWWRRRFASDLPLAIGLTPHQSSDAELVSRVVGVLGDTTLSPEQLTVWMPVQTLLTPQGVDNLKALANIGVRTGLDGFGTAPDGLASVEDLPVRSVRLARRLVERQAQALDSPLARALTAISPLAHRAGATVVVDGVRTQDQADWWRAAGADSAMGDLFGGACQPSDIATHLGTD